MTDLHSTPAGTDAEFAATSTAAALSPARGAEAVITQLLLDPAETAPSPAGRSSEVIYDTLRYLIVSGTLPAGTRLVEEELARQFSTSRSPVREAMRLLEHDGLLRVLRRGHQVTASISDAERDDLHSIRLAIDRLAARLGCRRVPPDGWTPVTDAIHRMGVVIESEGINSLAFVVAHLEVHSAIYRICFKGHLVSLMGRQLISYTTATDDAHPELPALSPVDQHLNLVTELASGNEDRAVNAAALHARRGYLRQ